LIALNIFTATMYNS